MYTKEVPAKELINILNFDDLTEKLTTHNLYNGHQVKADEYKLILSQNLILESLDLNLSTDHVDPDALSKLVSYKDNPDPEDDLDFSVKIFYK